MMLANKTTWRLGLALAFLLTFLAVPRGADAVPALDDEITVTQPDGASFRARIRGDEFQHWTEDLASRRTVVRNPKSGYWEYAETAADGSLKGSGLVVDPEGKAIPLHIAPELKPKRNQALENFQRGYLKQMYQERLQGAGSVAPHSAGPEQAAGDWTPVPVSGTRKVLVILVNFANRSLVTTAANWYNSVFSTTTGAKSVKNLFKDNSFSTLTVQPVSHTQNGGANSGVVTVTISDNHPDDGSASYADNGPTYAVESTVINHALAQADPYVNFAALDTNGNGTLEASEVSIYFIMAGYEQAGSSKHPFYWAHAWGGSGVSVEGKAVTRWALNGELNDYNAQHPMGVIAHELGHSLCGLPDLYDTSGTNGGLGHFSLMAGGSWGSDTGEYGGTTPTALDAWSREYLGWTQPQATAGSLSLGNALYSSTSAVKLANPAVSSTEYFLVENRYPTGWDRGLNRWFGSSWGGLLITHIDITVGTQGYNDINKYVVGGHQGVSPEQAKTTVCDMLNTTCRGDVTTLFYSANNSSFTDSTTPNARYYSGATSGFGVTGISGPGSTMTLTVTNPAVTPTCGTPASITVPASDPDGSYTVSWGASATAGVTYQLQEATNSTFTTGLRTAYSGTNRTVTITGRTAGKTYYYRVRATKTGYTASAWKKGANGCLVGTVCGIPTSITVPANNATGSYTVSWGASATAGVTYQLQEATNSTFTSGVRTAYSGTALSASITGRSTAKTYYYRVRATKTGYTASAWKTAANGCLVKFNCAAPASITVPASDPDGSYTVSWGASATAGVTYTLQEATNATFTTGLRTAYSGTNRTVSITGRTAGKTYYYRVRATKTGYNASAWKKGANGCLVGTVCGVPSSITVPASDADGSYTVSWGASATAGVTYQLQEATNATFTTGVRTAYSGTNRTVNITGRSSGKTYYYRVRATKSGYNASAWKKGANGCAVGASAGDAYEPDNTYAQAKVINLNTTQSRSFAPVGDADWVKFTCSTGDYEVFTAGSMDTYLEVYDLAGNPLGIYDDDSGVDYNAYLWLTCSGTGTWLLKVTEYGNNSTGNYSLTYRTKTNSAAGILSNGPDIANSPISRNPTTIDSVAK